MDEFLAPLNDFRILPIIEHQYSNFNENKQIDEEIYELYINSRFYKIYGLTGRVKREDVIAIYREFRESLIPSGYQELEMFLRICDFFPIDYNVIHRRMTSLERERVFRSIFKRNFKHTKRLF